MTQTASSPVDRALALSIGGKKDDAVRLLVALLEASAEQPWAAALLARALIAAGRDMLAADVAAKLVGTFTERGDLPAAVLCARAMKEGGEDPAALRKKIAESFGKGSKRASAETSPAPPPLPHDATPDKALSMLKGDPLLDRAESALAKALAVDDGPPAAKVPLYPLFGALAPKDLEKLLGALEVREVAADGKVVGQGEEGREAFVVVRGAVTVTRAESDGSATTLAALGPGAIFGEMALVSDAPRAASVTASEPTLLLVATRDALEQLAKSTPVIGQELGAFCRGRMVANLLRHSAILRAIADPAQREAVMGLFETRTFEAGAALVHAGEEGKGLFLVASGEVRVTSKDADGETLLIAQLGPGDVVGEISLVLRRPATADVVAGTPTVALELSRERFHEAIREHPALLAELYDLATKREEETRSVVAQQALDASDFVLV